MADYEYMTKEEVLKKGREVIGIPLKEIDKTGRITTGKGAIGTMIEESWFNYKPNSEAKPDFEEAGVELKVTPYIKTSSGVKAKERLVCNIINYMTEYERTFSTSDFWLKCQSILIMSYEHQQNIDKGDFTIDEVVLFGFPKEDRIIIEQDWEKIIDKIKAGQAHLISEGDTLYLGACTKGADSTTLREQPRSDEMAMQRAYCLKASYMTHILNTYVYGDKENQNIVKDWSKLKHIPFEKHIEDKVRQYIGKTQDELKLKFGIKGEPKNLNELILAKMLEVNGKVSKTEEFMKAGIVPKTIRISPNGKIKESMSFPNFNFIELIGEEWESSTLYNILAPTKFLFVVFKKNSNGQLEFEKLKFWNIPLEDLEEVHRVWQRTVNTIREGVKLEFDGKVTHNNLPKQTESNVAHVRPHGKNKLDTLPLPDGRQLTKQCFWLNSGYILTQILD